MSKRWQWPAALAAAACMALPRAAAAQSCAPSHLETVNAAFAQIGELGGRKEWVDDWVRMLGQGQTVKYMVYANLHDAGYFARFVNGRPSSAILADLYRHILAREPDDGAAAWIGVGETQGWHVVIDALLNSAEYSSRFGDHVVPGDPIVAWDCTRANLTALAHQGTVRDATQGGAAVSYSTPAYVSLDQPRSLTFAYSSGTAKPTGLVQVNLVEPSTTTADRASIQLYINNAAVTSETFFSAGAGATRLAAQFDASANYSAAYLVTAVVRTYQNTTRLSERSLTGRVPVVNERNSPFGAGWMLGGHQRMLNQGDGVFITEGGVGLWFERIGACGADGICRFTSPAGDFSKMTYNGHTFDRRYPDGSLVRFEHDGRMLDHRDRFGNLTVYGYDGSGRLTSITDPIGKVTTLGYTGAGALAWVQDPMGRRVTNESYQNALYHFRHPDGTLALDLHLVQDATGAWVLDTSWTEAAPRTTGWHMGTKMEYDAHGRVAAVTSPQVAVTEAGVGTDVQARPVVRTRSLEMVVLAAPGTGTLSNPAARVRPENVRVQVINTRGDTTRVAVDPFGAPTRIEEPLGRVTVLTRDRFGRVVRAQAPSGHVTRAEYRGMDLRLTQDLATEATVEMEYEPTYHQLTHMWGTGVTEVWNYYDAQARLDSTKQGALTRPATMYGYTTRGRVKSVTDAEGHGTVYNYGPESGSPAALGNLQSVNVGTAGGSSWRTTTRINDAYGRDSVNISPGNDVARTEYDLRNRVRKTIDGEGGAIEYAHQAGHLYQVKDAKGQYYHFHNDALGRLGSEVDPRGQYTYYRYDRAGNLTSVTNRRGQTVTAVYDALGQRTSRTADGQTTTWSYDPSGRWTQAENSESRNRVEYDVAGRPTHVITTLGGVTYTQVVTIDAKGRYTQSNVYGPWAGARSMHYVYNGRGQLETLWDYAGGATHFAYNDDGQEEGRTLPTGLGLTQGYSSNHVTAGTGYSIPAVDDKLGTGYHQDLNGRIDARRTYTTILGPQPGRGELVRRYSYDKRGWLGGFTDEQFTEGSTGDCPGGALQTTDPEFGACVPPRDPSSQPIGGQSFTYDAVGNRTDQNAVLEPGNRLTGFRSYQLTYDADGNLTRKLLPGYDDLQPGWNSLGQMAGAWRYQRGTVSYGYDADGRRVRRTAPDGTITRYLYDGDDLLMELDAAGNPTRTYTYYPGVDQPHSVQMNGQTYYYATDNPGHVKGLVDASNNVVTQYAYGPWGEVESATGTVTQPLGYMAREYDETTGLYNVRARWYDPHQGRFVSEDPSGLVGGINPYAYADNSPTNLLDPSGLETGSPVQLEGLVVNACPKGQERGGDGRCHPVNGGGGRSAPDPRADPGRGNEPRGTYPAGNNPAPNESSSPKKPDWGACGSSALGLGISAAGDFAFGGGLKVALSGARAIKAGRAAARAATNGAWRQAGRNAAGNYGRSATTRGSRYIVAGGQARVLDGLGEAATGWAAGVSDSALLAVTAGDPAWTLLPLAGTAYGMYETGRDCGSAVAAALGY